jgi:indolepyruvate ferredoxin oxidoreductase alpha subunit
MGLYRGTADPSLPAELRALAPLRRAGLVVAGDIGCYTLGCLPPLLAIDTTGCMGASIGNALGMAKAGLRQRVVAVIGDSTFLHSGITPLLDVVYNGGAVTVLILDNSTTAMTGHQEHPGTGRTAKGEPTRRVDLAALVRAVGIEDVQLVDAFDLAAVEAALRVAVDRDEPSVVIARGECVLRVRGSAGWAEVSSDLCDGCAACVRTGCPAIGLDDGKARIDRELCVGERCAVCVAVCPERAISLAPSTAPAGGAR